MPGHGPQWTQGLGNQLLARFAGQLRASAAVSAGWTDYAGATLSTSGKAQTLADCRASLRGCPLIIRERAEHVKLDLGVL